MGDSERLLRQVLQGGVKGLESVKAEEVREGGRKDDLAIISLGCCFPVSLYRYPPVTEVLEIKEVHKLCVCRLDLLRTLERLSETEGIRYTAKTQGVDALSKNELEIKQKMVTHSLALPKTSQDLTAVRSEEELQNIARVCRDDTTSHFLLKLAFCQDKEKSDWLVRMETQLMSLKLKEYKNVSVKKTFWTQNEYLKSEKHVPKASLSALEEFMHRFDIAFPKRFFPNNIVKSEVKETDHPFTDSMLYAAATEFRQDGAFNSDGTPYLYEIPFYPDATFLIRKRQTLVRGGFAYVAPNNLDTLLLSVFRRTLREHMDALHTRFQKVQRLVFQDEKIGPFLEALPDLYVGPQFASGGVADENDPDRLRPDMIAEVFRPHFPPCMRRLFEGLTEKKKLRHYGRQQLWLFLKGAGLSLEENIKLNRSLWEDSTSFNKEHMYGLRHIYGKEGKRVDYSPMSCTTIQNSLPIPSKDDFHGCPFRSFDENPLRNLMQVYGIPKSDLPTVLQLAKSKQPHLACVAFFKGKHSGSLADGVGNHPNQFLKEALKFKKTSPIAKIQHN